jgi:hypothetical protein
LRRFQHDDDLFLFIEAAGFVALLSHQVPQAILESNSAHKATLETIKATLERIHDDGVALERAHSWAEQTARNLNDTCKQVKNAALEAVTKLDTKALSEKLSATLVQSIEQSVMARAEITAGTEALKKASAQYREEVRQLRRWQIPWIFALAWFSAILFFGILYFVTWESHRRFLDSQAQQQIAASMEAVRQLQKDGVEVKVVQDHDSVYLIVPGAAKAYLSNNGEGVIAIEPP